ncbi:MAG: dockerin type I repeat-containing protein [Euryarchaeota archaeon]|nr:dockerin type I repeat-containing protein [Euryarchaeota archaeon]
MKNRLHASAVVITVLIASAMLASVCTGRVVTCPTDMTGMDMFDDRRLNMIDPSMGMSIGRGMAVGMGSTYPEHIEMGSTSPDSPFTHGMAAGDLNGDGDSDVLIFNGTYNSSGYLGTCTYDCVSAVDGRDGTELWSQDVDYETMFFGLDYPAYPVGDIDGVAGADVVMESCSYDMGTDTHTDTVQVIQGSDGTELWNYSVTGDGQCGSTLLYTYWYGDLVGDDLNDVVVVLQSYNSSDDTTTYTLRVMQGSDGGEIWSESVTEDGYLLLWVYLCGDICGDDGKDDVVVLCNSDTTSTARALQGSDGDESWNASIEGIAINVGPCGDLSGSDGRDDLVVWSIYDPGTHEFTTATLHFLRGTNGQEFRNQSITGEYVSLAAFPADLDSGGNDLIIQSTSYNSTTGKCNCTVYAVEGSDWHEFWSQSVTGDDDGVGGSTIWAYPYCDLDGDGNDEVIVNSWSYDSGTGDTAATVTVRDGNTPSVFWSDSISGPNASMIASSYGDLDGGGKDDVVVMRSCDSGAGNTTASVCVKKDSTSTVLWGDGVTGKDVWMEPNYCAGWHYQPDQDYDRDSLRDLLITTGASTDVYMDMPHVGTIYVGSVKTPTRVCAVKGNTGKLLWCKLSASSEPEPSVTGDLNDDGVITPADAVIALNIVVSGDYSEDADVNGDGVTNSLDASMILYAAAGAIML